MSYPMSVRTPGGTDVSIEIRSPHVPFAPKVNAICIVVHDESRNHDSPRHSFEFNLPIPVDYAGFTGMLEVRIDLNIEIGGLMRNIHGAERVYLPSALEYGATVIVASDQNIRSEVANGVATVTFYPKA